MKNLLRHFGFLMLLTVIVFFATGCPPVDSEDTYPAPTGLTAKVVHDKIIVLSWNKVKDAGYTIYGSFESGGPFIYIGYVGYGTGFYVTHMDDQQRVPLEPETTYYFKVGCYYDGELSPEVSATTGKWEK